MILIICLLAVALILLGVGTFFLWGMPDSKSAPARRVRLILIGSGLCMAGGLAAGIVILVQEKTGLETGLSGGIESDARQWISQHSLSPPAADQPGDNIAILREGLTFVRRHSSGADGSADAHAIIARYGTLPERPTRLLTRSEEAEYFEGAKAVYRYISNIARQETKPESQ